MSNELATTENVTIGDITITSAEFEAVLTHTLASAGIDKGEQIERDALTGVWQDDPSLFTEDHAAYLAANPPVDSPRSAPTEDDYAAAALARKEAEEAATNAKDVERQARRKLALDRHEEAIKRVASLIVAKYRDEGDRNLEIGKEAFSDAVAQRDDFVANNNQEYVSGDFDRHMSRVVDEVRAYVPIKPQSIRVAEWVRCHLLKLEVAKIIGTESADKLSFFEYRELQRGTRALAFDKKALESKLNDGWIDMIRDVADKRSRGITVKSETFLEKIAETEQRILASTKTATEMASELAKKERAKNNAKREAVSESIADVIGLGLMSPDQVLAVLETTAKHSGAELPSSIGFNPKTVTMEDVDALANAMRAFGKVQEMRRLHSVLGKLLNQVDTAKAAAVAQQHASTVRLRPTA